MTEIVSYQPGRPKYYKHSGKFAPRALPLTLGGGIASAIVLGFLYSTLVIYNPLAEWTTLAGTIATSAAIGVLLAKGVKANRIRNLNLALFIAVITAVMLLLSAWITWVYALLQIGHVKITLLSLLTHPVGFVRVVLLINSHGAWSIFGIKPTGIALWLIWGIEATILLTLPIKMVYTAVTEQPFCEHCCKWGSSQVLMRYKRANLAELRQKLTEKDFTVLTTLEQSPEYAKIYWKIYLQGCSDCDTTQTLCVDHIELSTSNGKTKIKATSIIKRLLLTPDDTVTLATTIAMMSTPGEEADDANANIKAKDSITSDQSPA